MAMSCFLKKLCSPVLRGSVLENLNNNIRKPSCSVFIIHQAHHHQSSQCEKPGKELYPLKYGLKSTTLLNCAKQFSTSPALLAQHKGHDHSKLWTLEKLLSVVLLPLVPAALLSPSQALDTALAVIVVLHTHFGLEAVVVDYIRPILFGEIIPKIGLAALYLFSIVTLAGLLNLIYNDAGLANTIINVWKK